VDTPTDVLPKKNRRYGVDDLDARVNEIANAIQRTAGKASLGDRICFIKENHWGVSNFVVGRTFIFGVGG
jgi:putative uncharacterized protein (fragment)